MTNLINKILYYNAYPIKTRGQENENLRLRSCIGVSKLGNLIQLIEQYQHIEGAIAEVGVWRGGIGILFGELKIPNKHVYLFDTFEGLPYKDDKDNFHIVGDFDDTSLEEVSRTLSEYDNISLHKGIFPIDTGHIIQDEKFSIVHLDVDLYQAYIESLNFFYEKTTPGGIILLDDYNEPTCAGATIAVDEFLVDKKETIQVHGSQYYIVKQ
jgi:hypothetical protein